MAQRYITGFGVATVCGWGRLSQSEVDSLIDLHVRLTKPLPAPDRVDLDFIWPSGFDRVPNEPWSSTPLEQTGLTYDQVDTHSWYSNLDPTVAELERLLSRGGVLIDFSGGTGILVDRLKSRLFGSRVGSVIVDSSPKFLRVAVEKFRHDPTVAFRHLRSLRDEGRLQRLDEVLDRSLMEQGVDVIASTNAIHLYTDLPDTVASWVRVLRPDGTVVINSGNIRNPGATESQWILDETVWVIADLAEGIVRTDDSYAPYRSALQDPEGMKRHAAFRDRVFLEPRPLSYYVDTLENSGLKVTAVRQASIEANVHDWFEFLCAYHEAVLGWVGGTERVEGTAPSEKAVQDRLRLIRQSIELLFGQRKSFEACWTYLTCTKAS